MTTTNDDNDETAVFAPAHADEWFDVDGGELETPWQSLRRLSADVIEGGTLITPRILSRILARLADDCETATAAHADAITGLGQNGDIAPSIRAVGPGWIETDNVLWGIAAGVFINKGDGSNPRIEPVAYGGCTLTDTSFAELRAAIVEAINWRGGVEPRPEPSIDSPQRFSRHKINDDLAELLKPMFLLPIEITRDPLNNRRGIHVKAVGLIRDDGKLGTLTSEAFAAVTGYSKAIGCKISISWDSTDRSMIPPSP